MKIDQILFIRKRITMNQEDMIELESLLMNYCDCVKYAALTEDKSQISYDNLEEMLKQDNFGDKKIRKVEIRSTAKESPNFVNIELDGREGIGKSNIVISYSFSNPKEEKLFQNEIKNFFEKRKDGDKAYNIAAFMMIPASMTICFFLLWIYLKFIGSNINVVMPVLLLLVMALFLYLVYGVCGKLFPAVSFVWGEEKKHYELIVKYRNNIFWCVIVTMVVSIGCAVLIK